MISFNNLREIIEQTVDIKIVAKKLGLEVNKHNFSLCPFHDDRHPSLHFYDKKTDSHQQYHCFSCNAHGSMFDLVKELQGVDYTGSLKWLAQNFGIPYKNYVLLKNTDNVNIKDVLDKLLQDVNNNESLKEWANNRKIPNITLRNANVIFIQNNYSVFEYYKKHLKDSTYIEFLISLGLLNHLRIKSDKYKSIQYFPLENVVQNSFNYNHILFPIRDLNSNIVGFAARKTDDLDPKIPKYKYTKGFKRSQNLYGIDLVYKNVAKLLREKKSDDIMKVQSFDLFIVEGFVDVLRLNSLGFCAVGVLGSSLSDAKGIQENQIQLIKKIAQKLGSIRLQCHIFLDNDSAGKSGTIKAISQLLGMMNDQFNIYIDVVIALNSKDPDEMFKSNGFTEPCEKPTTEILSLIRKNTYSIIEYYSSHLLGCEIEMIDWEKIRLNKLLYSQLQREIYLNFLSIQTNIELHEIQNAFVYGKEVEKRDVAIDEIYLQIISFSQRKETKLSLIIDRKKLHVKEHLLTKAIDLAEASYVRSEFCYDIYAFDRIRVTKELLQKVIEDNLEDDNFFPLEPYTPSLEPREGNSEPRLKTLPCPEDLVIQNLILLALVEDTFELTNNFQIPAVIHTVGKKEKRVFGPESMVSYKYTKDNTEEPVVVSFAYQFESATINAFIPEKNNLFRHFSKCWNDYNNYILNCLRNYKHNETFYAERYDISRYYDNIKSSHLMPLLFGLNKDGNLSEEVSILGIKHTVIWEQIRNYSFNYKYYSPSDGKELTWPKNEIGIPQGPSLSAWLANIFLFKIDKAVQEIVNSINKKYGYLEVAIYARYVDDIILIAPEREYLIELEETLREELFKIDLNLSDKVESVSSMNNYEFKKWLYNNRGFPGASINSDPTLHKSVSIEKSLIKLKTLTADRKDILNILHSTDMIVPNKNSELLNKLLDQTKRYVGDLKYRDFVHIAKQLWYEQIISDSEENTDIIAIANKLKSKYADHIVNADKNFNSEFLSNIIYSLNKNWYLIVTLEGLNKILSSQYYKTPELDDSYQENYKNKISKFTQNICEKNYKYEDFNSFCEETSNLKTLIELYLLKMYQLVYTLLDKKKVEIERLDSILLARYNIGFYRDSESYIVNNYKAARFVKLYNEIYKTKWGFEPSKNEIKSGDPYSTLDCLVRVANLFVNSQGTTVELNNDIYFYLFHIIGRLNLTYENNKLLLNNRGKIKQYVCWDGKKDHFAYILPSYSEIDENEIISMNIYKKDNVADSFADSFAILYSPKNKIKTIIGLEGEIDENFDKLVDFDLCRYDQCDFKWKQLTFRNMAAIECIKHIIGLYQYIEKVGREYLDKMLINPHNILFDSVKKEYFILSKEYDDNSNVINYAHTNKTSFRINPNYGYVWRLGWSLNAMQGLLNQNEVDFVSPNIVDRKNWVEDAILDKLLFDIRGIYWKGEESAEFIPIHIKNYFSNLKDIEKQTETQKLEFLFEQNEIETVNYNEDKSLYLCNLITSNLFRYSPNMIDHINKYFPSKYANNELLSELRVSVQSWILLGEKFKNLSNYTFLCRSRATHIYINKIVLNIIVFCLNKGKSNMFWDNIEDLSLITEPKEIEYSLKNIIKEIKDDDVTELFEKLSIYSLIRIMEYFLRLFAYLFDLQENKIPEMINSVFRSLNDFGERELRFANFPSIMISSVFVEKEKFENLLKEIIKFEKQLGFKITNVKSRSLNEEISEEGILCNTTADKILLPHYSFVVDKLHFFDRSEMFKEANSDGRIFNDFTEITIKNNITKTENVCEINTISNHFNKLVSTQSPKDKNEEVIESNNVVKIEQEIDDNNKIHSEKGRSSKSETKPANENKSKVQQSEVLSDKIKQNIDRFQEIQEEVWKSREDSENKLVRIAFFQFQVDETYSHPLSEVCDDVELGKFKTNPEEFKSDKIEEAFSCAEHIRKAKLDSVINACITFKVDVLLLPEYSVRPETVIFMKEKLEKLGCNTLAIWCGTFKVPNCQDDNNIAEYLDSSFSTGTIRSHNSILTLLYPLKAKANKPETEKGYDYPSNIPQYKLKTRGKKYPAVSTHENFYPHNGKIIPLTKDINSVENLNFFTELICAENFILTSPTHINQIAIAWRRLNKLYKTDPTKDSMDSLNIYREDINEFNKNCSDFPIQGESYSPWRRKILLIPAMTSRNIDFYTLGEQLILSSGMTTVFCNSVRKNHNFGGSCIITGDSFNKKDVNKFVSQNDSPYSDILPGIYQRCHENNGTLSEDEESLVIVDVDPIYATSPKPTKQSRTPRHRLIAHLPIIELSDGFNLSFKEKRKCACQRIKNNIEKYSGGKKKRNWIEDYLSEIVNDSPNFNTLSKTFREIFSFSKTVWIEEKLNAFKNQSKNKPSMKNDNSIPAIFTDILIVKYNNDTKPNIKVPSFSDRDIKDEEL
jgi:DNA primase catalytic core